MKKAFTVALIGPDGTGKSTITGRLLTSLHVPVKHIYMGINMDVSNYVLPTTLLWHKTRRARGRQKDMGGPPDPSIHAPVPRHPVLRGVRELKSSLRMMNLIAEEWYRQSVAWYYQQRGYIVIFDRHFYFDYYKYHIAEDTNQRTFGDRVHGLMLKYLYPKPTLVICLDAPAEILFARKREGSVELLQQRRQEYLAMQDKIKHFVVVDASQPVDAVVEQICTLIMDFHALKNRTADTLSNPRVR